MPKKKPTTIDGVETGKMTESGNPNHDGKTGEFKAKNKLKERDENFCLPFSNYKLLPVLNNLGKQDGFKIFDIYDPNLGFTKEALKELDQSGTDYMVFKDGKHYSIDLKTIYPEKGNVSDYIYIPLWHFDTNYENNEVSGKHVTGWALKNNDTTAYLFSLPKIIPETDNFSIEKYGNMDFDAFMINKKKFDDILIKTYFNDFVGENKNSLTALENVKDFALNTNKKLYNQILENKEKIKLMEKQKDGNPLTDKQKEELLCPKRIDGFKVYYDENKRIKTMSKIIIGNMQVPIKLVIKQEFVDGENFPRQNVYLKCHKNVIKINNNCQLLNPKQSQDRILKDIFRV